MTDSKIEKLITVSEAADFLGLAEGTVRNKANAGDIPSVKLGAGKSAPLRFRKSELADWIVDKQAEGADR